MPATTIQVPELEDITEFMQGLYGLEVSAAKDCPLGVYSVAEYQNESGETLAYLSCDLASGCRLGAALTQVPASRVDEAVTAGQIPDALAENLAEIFNISVNLIVKPEHGRVVLANSYHGDVPAETTQAIEALTDKEFCFQIQRYGNCRLVVSC